MGVGLILRRPKLRFQFSLQTLELLELRLSALVPRRRRRCLRRLRLRVCRRRRSGYLHSHPTVIIKSPANFLLVRRRVFQRRVSLTTNVRLCREHVCLCTTHVYAPHVYTVARLLTRLTAS